MARKKVEYRRAELAVHIPDTRGVHISPWGKGNLKLGQGKGLYTYSKLPGLPQPHGGTCPGATDTCLRVCYAFRVRETPLVWGMWEENTKRAGPPPELPKDAKIIRIHVAGDFVDDIEIMKWTSLALRNRKVRFWAYTRSWRVPELLPHLEELRAQPNVQLFASVDAACIRDDWMPPEGWRWAWLGEPDDKSLSDTPRYPCPEENGRKPNCMSCRYCFDGKRGDVVFSVH